jgi:hypothetical protein
VPNPVVAGLFGHLVGERQGQFAARSPQPFRRSQVEQEFNFRDKSKGERS